MDDEIASSDIEQIFASGRRSRSNSVIQQKLSSTRSEGTAPQQQQQRTAKIPPRLSLSAQGEKAANQERPAVKNDLPPMPKPRSKPPPPSAPATQKPENVPPSEGLVPGSLTEGNETAPVHVYNDELPAGGEMKNETVEESLDDYSQQQQQQQRLPSDRVQSAEHPDEQDSPNEQPAQQAQSEMPISEDDQEDQGDQGDRENRPSTRSASLASPIPPTQQPLPVQTADTPKYAANFVDENNKETPKDVQQNISSRPQSAADRTGQKVAKTRVIYSRDKRKDNAPVTERTKLRDQLFESEERNRILRQRLGKLSLKSEQLIDENRAIKCQLEQGLRADHLIVRCSSFYALLNAR